jgi:K+-transporting ATPase KdpF subunit
MCISAIASGERVMQNESVVMVAICALMMVYLIYALLRPEKF